MLGAGLVLLVFIAITLFIGFVWVREGLLRISLHLDSLSDREADRVQSPLRQERSCFLCDSREWPLKVRVGRAPQTGDPIKAYVCPKHESVDLENEMEVDAARNVVLTELVSALAAEYDIYDGSSRDATVAEAVLRLRRAGMFEWLEEDELSHEVDSALTKIINKAIS